MKKKRTADTGFTHWRNIPARLVRVGDRVRLVSHPDPSAYVVVTKTAPTGGGVYAMEGRFKGRKGYRSSWTLLRITARISRPRVTLKHDA